MTTLPYSSAHHAPKLKYQPSRGRANRSCAWCGQRLTGQHTLTCSASCRSQLSRRKRRTCEVAMCAEFGYGRDTARALLARFGLARIEAVMTAVGWRWQAADRAWLRESGRILERVA